MNFPIGFWHTLADAICTNGTSTIPNLNDIGASGLREVGAKWDDDGDVYYYQDAEDDYPINGQSTWIGDCANTEYEGRWTDIGDDSPDFASFTVDVWTEMSTAGGMEVTMATSSFQCGQVIFELRRKSDQVVVITDTFDMEVGLEEK
jgi:hypothetical protein